LSRKTGFCKKICIHPIKLPVTAITAASRGDGKLFSKNYQKNQKKT
jgi:hypothetical protein